MRIFNASLQGTCGRGFRLHSILQAKDMRLHRLQGTAYLLLLRSCRDNVIHQHGHQFRHSVNTGSKSAIWGGAVDNLPLGFGLFQPFAGH